MSRSLCSTVAAAKLSKVRTPKPDWHGLPQSVVLQGLCIVGAKEFGMTIYEVSSIFTEYLDPLFCPKYSGLDLLGNSSYDLHTK